MLFMNPYPEKHSVLVMDNAMCHHVEDIEGICEEKCVYAALPIIVIEQFGRGIKLIYLPPYSPDLPHRGEFLSHEGQTSPSWCRISPLSGG
jgi:transposase